MNTATEHGELSATLLLDSSVIDDPYGLYRRLVAEAPVWCVPETEIVVVSSYDAVTEVVNRVDDFSSNLPALLYRSAVGTPALLLLPPSPPAPPARARPPPRSSLAGPAPPPPRPPPPRRCTQGIAARCFRSSSPAAWPHSARTSKRSPRSTSPGLCRANGSR